MIKYQLTRRYVMSMRMPGSESFFARYLGLKLSIHTRIAFHQSTFTTRRDNSSFAVTTLLQEPESGGVFEYVPDVRDSDDGDMAFDRVAAVLDNAENISQLNFDPGDLVLFRGRNALHRVTPTEGSVTRVLAVFAYNDEPDIGLSTSALETFYGRTK